MKGRRWEGDEGRCEAEGIVPKSVQGCAEKKEVEKSRKKRRIKNGGVDQDIGGPREQEDPPMRPEMPKKCRRLAPKARRARGYDVQTVANVNKSRRRKKKKERNAVAGTETEFRMARKWILLIG